MLTGGFVMVGAGRDAASRRCKKFVQLVKYVVNFAIPCYNAIVASDYI
jgi:hypothetical protein